MQVYNREKWIDIKGPSSGVFTKSSGDGCKCLINQTKIKNNQLVACKQQKEIDWGSPVEAATWSV